MPGPSVYIAFVMVPPVGSALNQLHRTIAWVLLAIKPFRRLVHILHNKGAYGHPMRNGNDSINPLSFRIPVQRAKKWLHALCDLASALPIWHLRIESPLPVAGLLICRMLSRQDSCPLIFVKTIKKAELLLPQGYFNSSIHRIYLRRLRRPICHLLFAVFVKILA